MHEKGMKTTAIKSNFYVVLVVVQGIGSEVKIMILQNAYTRWLTYAPWARAQRMGSQMLTNIVTTSEANKGAYQGRRVSNLLRFYYMW